MFHCPLPPSAMFTDASAGIILCMRPANERRHYNVTSSLIGWAHTQNDLCLRVPIYMFESLGLLIHSVGNTSHKTSFHHADQNDAAESHYSSTIEHVTLVAITGTTILLPNLFVVKSRPCTDKLWGAFCMSSTCYSLQLHIVYNITLQWNPSITATQDDGLSKQVACHEG